MALVDIDTWFTEYVACERLSHDIQAQIVTRNQQPRLSNEYSKISSTVRFKLKQFETNLEQLNSLITQAATKGSITSQEAERRQRQVETLHSQYGHLQSQFVKVSNSDKDRNDLMNNAGKAHSYWQNGSDDDDDDEPMAEFRPKGSEPSVDDIRKQQNRILENQDEGLDALSKVISRQKHLALRIGDEFDDQNVIIDQLTNTMDNTNTRINGTTQNVNDALRSESTKFYWFIIIVLFIINIIVGVL